MVPLSFGCGSAVLAAIATLAPSRAARSAIASPMPRLPPDMNRVLAWRDVIERTPVVWTVDRHGCAERKRVSFYTSPFGRGRRAAPGEGLQPYDSPPNPLPTGEGARFRCRDFRG